MQFNDISNMNGGYFPIHKGHETGLEIDGKFPGYENRDEAALNKLVQLINTWGRAIDLIWVKTKGKPVLQQAILNAPLLLDGRRVSDVIKNDDDHWDHFHVNLSSRAPVPR